MKAAQLVEPFRFDLRPIATPTPASDELLVRMEGCGVCGSNLPPWRGARGTEFPLAPGAPGHEGWGRVVEAGNGSSDLEGRRVAVLSTRAFAELDVARRDQVVPLPRALEGRDVPGEPLACAVNVARRAGVDPGDTVVVVGIGFLGALLLPLLRESGPEELIAVSRRRTSLAMAERMGAHRMLRYDEARGDLLDGVDGGAADVVVEATGEQGPLDLATELCRVRGRLIVAGYHQDGPRRVDMRLWNWRGLDVINAHERDPGMYVEGMRRALRRIVDGTLDPEPLVTHRLPLADIQRAFELAHDRDEGFFKAVVVSEEDA